MAGSKRNSGYIARGSGSGMNRNSGGKGSHSKKSSSKKPLGFDLGDTESRIAFYTFIVVCVLVLTLIVTALALSIAHCVGGDAVSDADAANAASAVEDTVSGAEIVSYADGVVSFADIVSEGDTD